MNTMTLRPIQRISQLFNNTDIHQVIVPVIDQVTSEI